MLGGMRVRLASSWPRPERAIAVLRELAGSESTAVRPTSEHAVDKRDDYVGWALRTEAALEGVLRKEDAQAFFDNPRHREICSMTLGNHLPALIYSELRAKAREFEAAADDLQRQLDRMRASPGFPVVVDTNVLIQYQRLDSVSWPTEVREARVMVPLRVIEEIDAKKYGDSKRLRSVARGLLSWIDGLFGAGYPGPVKLRSGHADTIELLLAERPRYRPSDADEEVLDVAHEVLHFAGRVKVLTADTGMRIRARSEGLEVLLVPEAWARLPSELDRDGQ